ncbi:YlbF family regulator [Verrucomicrobiales bacterium]|jgi:cell fate (sporulation/competence/biofilm development) regulator YlbF (YheA/YmcA/DUF963 family)|nr:YlbF family regulator [bacterium]MDB4808327.1 YlbF family regulator [Verrucomicrobiales bacterium]MDF1786502.1 YlbF family regulator [Verrucomicrobiales bacterium]
MENLLDTPTIDTKSRELCQFIVDQPEFAAARGHIEAFLENAEAQAVYRAWQEKGQELQRMSHEGLQPNDDDIKQMEALRETVMKNEIASDFAEAESQMNGTFSTVTKLLQQTLQLGRVPSVDEMNAESGCCGGGGGEGGGGG